MVLVAVFVNVGRAVRVSVLVLMVFDRSLAVVMTRAVRVHVVGAVGVGVLVLCVLLGHDVLQDQCSVVVTCHYMRMHADSNLADDELSVAAEIFRLLADPTRVGILHALASKDEELSVTALAEIVSKRQAAVSQHLAKLRMGHLVTTRREGNQVRYRLANEHAGRLVLDALRHAEHLGPGIPAHHRLDES